MEGSRRKHHILTWRLSTVGYTQTFVEYEKSKKVWTCCGNDGCGSAKTNETFSAVSPADWTKITGGSSSNTGSVSSSTSSTPSTKTGSGTSATTTSSMSSTATSKSSTGLSTGAQAGIGVAVAVAGIALIVAIVAVVLIRRKRGSKKPVLETVEERGRSKKDRERKRDTELSDLPPYQPPAEVSETTPLSPTEISSNSRLSELSAIRPTYELSGLREGV